MDACSQSLSICHGDEILDLPALPSLATALQQAAAGSGKIVYIDADGVKRTQTYRDLAQRSSQIASGLIAAGAQSGDRVVLQIAHPQDFLAAIWACWLAELVAVPIAVPPAYSDAQPKAAQLRSICDLLDNPWIIVSSSLESAARTFLADRLLTVESLLKSPSLPEISDTAGDRLALILFTSGSTGQPKGVMLTDTNLRVSALGMARVNGLSDDSISLNWMPLEHVASLVMFHLTQVWVGCDQIHVNQDYVLQDPLRWLDLVDRFRVTTTWAPNFAYGLINDRAEAIAQRQWDLSCLTWMGNGAEAVVGKTTRLFLQLLAPFGLRDRVVSPGYGMSETTSGIVHSHDFSIETSSDADAFVEVGRPIPGVSLRIVDEDQLVPVGVTGSLQVRGLTVTSGYYGRSDLNAEAFTPDGWFITGDLGFLREGRLTITGRQKDLIILNGANFYSHEIEAVVEELPEVEVSFTAACAVRPQGVASDRLAIFLHPAQEIDLKDLVKTVRRQVMNRLGIAAEYVIPVDRAAIPKTALGKIARSQLSRQFEAGAFDPQVKSIALAFERSIRPPRNQLEELLIEIWRSVLKLEAIATDEQFFELGGSSLHLMQVVHQLHQRGYTIAAVDLFEHSTIDRLAKFLSQPATPKAVPSKQRRQNHAEDIAVIGLACRFPGADSPDRFWQNLQNGVESITFFSEAEILASGIDPALVRHPNYVKASPILREVDRFDADFFGYSPREAELIDPQQRLMLECAWESLEDAGYDPFAVAAAGKSIALYAGASMNSYLLNHVYPNRDRLDANDSLDVLTLSSMGGFQLAIANDKDYLTTRVSYKLNLTGPSVNVQTACSTSLVSIHLACRSLLQGECDFAMAGGVSIETPQTAGHLYQEGMILSPDGHCRAFDAQAQGTIFGSGAGVVVLKRLSDAIADHDRIYAVIKGSAIGNDGSMKVGYLAPRADGQASVISEAIAIANVAPDSITYVEAHGTGTELGDPIELAALTQAFRSGTSRHQFCAIGSVKTNLGHLNVASGVAGFIKTVLCLHHRQLPASLHFQQPNPQIDFANSPFFVNTALRDWETKGTPRRAGVNSLGIGGTNAHLVLEEAPTRPASEVEFRPLHLLTLSAKTPAALEAIARRYVDFFTSHADLSIAEVCFTANAGRSPFSHRLAIVTDSIADAQSQLQRWLASPEIFTVDSRPPIAFLFTGQGSQFAGMGSQLYETQSVFRQAIEACDQLLQPELNLSLRDLLYDEAHSHRLNQTQYAQPALFAVEYALYELWRSWGVQPDVVLGHSIGEYVAAYAAGVFSLADALKLVVHRGRLMQSQPAGAMASVFACVDSVRSILRSAKLEVAIAAINAPEHIVISGTPAQINQAIEQFQQQQISVKPLAVSHAFHSAMMEPIVAEFRSIAQTVEFSSPQLPLISNLTGSWGADEMATANYWCEQLRQPVQFAAGVEHLHQFGCAIALECGAKPILTSIAQAEDESQAIDWLASLHPKQDNWATLLHSLKQLYGRGVAIDWQAVDQPYARQRLSLPTYAFQRQRYWLDVKKSAIAPAAVPSIHPLLGQKIVTPKATLFDAKLSLDNLPYLADHRVHGAIVFPAAAYLEMAIAAGTMLLSAQSLRLENVALMQALTLESTARSLQMHLASEGDGRSFEVYSAPADRSDEWTLHCRGQLTADRSPPPIQDLLVLQRSFTQVAGADERRSSGLDYGARFGGLKQVWRRSNRALGWVQLPICLESEASAYHIHPALLDACLQVVLALIPAATLPYVPIGLDSLHYYGSVPHQLWSAVTLIDQSGDRLTADVELLDPQGKRVMLLTGLTAKAVSPQVWGRSIDWASWLYAPEWQPQMRSISAASQIGHWLILADAQGMSQPLIDCLEADQQDYSIAATERLDPNRPEDFDRLLQTLPIDRPLGVVYLWGLDATTLDQASRAYAGLLHLTQALIRSHLQPSLWLVTQGSQSLHIRPEGMAQASLWGLGRTIAREQPRLNCRCIDWDGQSNWREVWAELQSDSSEMAIAFNANQRYVAQLNAYAASTLVDRPLQLQIRERGSVEQVIWQPTERRSPADHEIELRVLTVGLNFRDLLNLLGRYPGDAGDLGLECVGEVVSVGAQVQQFQVGDCVMAIAPGCFRQFVTIPAQLAVSKPPALSIAAAATLPTAMLTADYALRIKGNLQAGDRVLIHAAAGGVGLAAVQIAQQTEAEIVATASPSKWPELQRRGITQIYSSRSLDFAARIQQEIGDRSIDVVLNSLSGEWMLKSAALLAPGGRFIEIGKPDAAWVEQLRQLRPDVDYIAVDLMAVTLQQPDLIQTLLDRLRQQMERSQLHPLPYTLFSRDRVVDAFRTMQQAQQIGKIVVEFAKPSFKPRSNGVYLVTGGLGGLGWQVAQALVDWGATHLLLIGRSAPSPAQAQQIARWQQASVQTATAQLDMADESAVYEFFQHDRPFANLPICGIFHAAGVLDDGAIANQTPERLEQVMAAKLRGAWMLHHLSLNESIDHFVLFSSAAALLGSAGQANYAAANAGLDALAHLRRSLNLPALSINWGAWAEVGMAAGLPTQKAIDPQTGIAILKALLSETTPQIGVLPDRPDRQTSPPPPSAESWIEEIHSLPSDRPAALAARLRQLVAQILGCPIDRVDVDQGLTELGIDSLTSIELTHQLQKQVQHPLSPNLLYNYPTITALTDYLIQLLDLSAAIDPHEPAIDPAAEIEQLSEDEATALLLSELDRLDL